MTYWSYSVASLYLAEYAFCALPFSILSYHLSVYTNACHIFGLASSCFCCQLHDTIRNPF